MPIVHGFNGKLVKSQDYDVGYCSQLLVRLYCAIADLYAYITARVVIVK